MADDPGTWDALEEWPQPFTVEQVARLSAELSVEQDGFDDVACVRVCPVGCSGWLICELPMLAEDITVNSEDGDPFEVQFGTLTRDQFDALGEFSGW